MGIHLKRTWLGLVGVISGGQAAGWEFQPGSMGSAGGERDGEDEPVDSAASS